MHKGGGKGAGVVGTEGLPQQQAAIDLIFEDRKSAPEHLAIWTEH
jgi:hypothetical protein